MDLITICEDALHMVGMVSGGVALHYRRTIVSMILAVTMEIRTMEYCIDRMGNGLRISYVYVCFIWRNIFKSEVRKS